MVAAGLAFTELKAGLLARRQEGGGGPNQWLAIGEPPSVPFRGHKHLRLDVASAWVGARLLAMGEEGSHP